MRQLKLNEALSRTMELVNETVAYNDVVFNLAESVEELNVLFAHLKTEINIASEVRKRQLCR